MNEALRLAPTLTAARLKARTGDAWLDLLAVLSFALSTLMALTVAGGIWMFSQWRVNPSASMVELATTMGLTGDDPAANLLAMYFSLALAAGALLIFPIFSLGAAAARLGARGRAERLSSLRLVGVTGGQTIAMSVVETLVQWFIGAAFGIVTYYLTLPLWHQVSFLQQQIDSSQMRLPIALLLGVLALLLAIALLSTVVGLQRVRISPLGVARREANPALKRWRPLAFIAALFGFILWTRSNYSLNDAATYSVMAIMILIMVGAISLVGPWILQLFAAPATRTSSVPRLLAMRRILDDPRSSWRTVNAISLLCFIAGFVAVIPMEANQSESFYLQDISTGVLITLGFGFAVAALSTLMNQSSTVFDRAPETYALSQLGFPRRVFGQTRFMQIMVPLFLATVASSLLGLGLGLLASAMNTSVSGVIRLGIILLIGIGLSVLALMACEPLERHVLATKRRSND
ncbi:FtsX-like permease family protein [Actinomycetaceae bacterium L2_0104]